MLLRRPQPLPVGPGQESVWDYPRPPRVEQVARLVEVRIAGVVLARSECPLRVCETASPPTYYVPAEDARRDLLRPGYGRSTCEYKGEARYWSVVVDDQRVDNAAASYPEPWEGYEVLTDYLAFYPGLVQCTLDGEVVRAQEGGFYGGWVTSTIVGPWKGAPGTGHW